jgi:hypothetical protein
MLGCCGYHVVCQRQGNCEIPVFDEMELGPMSWNHICKYLFVLLFVFIIMFKVYMFILNRPSLKPKRLSSLLPDDRLLPPPPSMLLSGPNGPIGGIICSAKCWNSAGALISIWCKASMLGGGN